MSAQRVSSDQRRAIRKQLLDWLERVHLIKCASNQAGGLAKSRIARSDPSCRNPGRPFVLRTASHHYPELPMIPTITAFKHSPDGGKGLARDMRVRWALEEAGQPYDVRLVSFSEMKEGAHRALHPFGQIPTYEDGDLVLFESGAIVFHIAERHAGLLPDDANARARAITWMFAALSSVEPPILDLVTARFLEGEKPWSKARLPLVVDRVHDRLKLLSARLGDAEWLDGAFSAGDLMMVSVLLRLKPSGLLGEHPDLSAYVARGEARPAFRRAFDAQLAVFRAASSG
jgi:glutathione S-transferase